MKREPPLRQSQPQAIHACKGWSGPGVRTEGTTARLLTRALGLLPRTGAASAGRRYTPLAPSGMPEAARRRGTQEARVKKVFGLFAVFAAIGGALMFWRKRQTDDEFLDEEIE